MSDSKWSVRITASSSDAEYHSAEQMFPEENGKSSHTTSIDENDVTNDNTNPDDNDVFNANTKPTRDGIVTADNIATQNGSIITGSNNVSFIDINYTIQPKQFLSCVRKTPKPPKKILQNVRYVVGYILLISFDCMLTLLI